MHEYGRVKAVLHAKVTKGGRGDTLRHLEPQEPVLVSVLLFNA